MNTVWIYGDGNVHATYAKLVDSAYTTWIDKTRPSHGAMNLVEFVLADLGLGVPRASYPEHVVLGYNGGAMAWIFEALHGVRVPHMWSEADTDGLKFAVRRFRSIGATVHLLRGPGVYDGMWWGRDRTDAADRHIDDQCMRVANHFGHAVNVIDGRLPRRDGTLFGPGYDGTGRRDPHVSEKGAQAVADKISRAIHLVAM